MNVRSYIDIQRRIEAIDGYEQAVLRGVLNALESVSTVHRVDVGRRDDGGLLALFVAALDHIPDGLSRDVEVQGYSYRKRYRLYSIRIENWVDTVRIELPTTTDGVDSIDAEMVARRLVESYLQAEVDEFYLGKGASGS